MSARKRLESLNDEQKQEAQEKLNKLCDLHNRKRLTLKATSDWKNLVFDIIGIPKMKRNRPGGPAYTRSEVEQVLHSIDVHNDLPPVDEENNILPTPFVPKKVWYFKIAETFLKQGKKLNGKTPDPYNQVKHIEHVYGDKREKYRKEYEENYCDLDDVKKLSEN